MKPKLTLEFFELRLFIFNQSLAFGNFRSFQLSYFHLVWGPNIFIEWNCLQRSLHSEITIKTNSFTIQMVINILLK